MPHEWQASHLSMGGGINCIAISDDGQAAGAGGDISGHFRALRASDLKDWAGANRGGYDGGQHGAHSGEAFKAGSHDDCLRTNKAGVWVTNDFVDSCEWRNLISTISFGEGGGEYPRNNVGHTVDSAGDYTYFVRGTTGSAILGRYRWSTDTVQASVITVAAVVGEGVAADPQRLGDVIVATRNGVYLVKDAHVGGAPVVTKFSGTRAPTNGGAVVMVVDENSARWLIVGDGSTGVKRLGPIASGVAWPTGQAWDDITGGTLPTTSPDYAAIDAVYRADTDDIEIVVGVANPLKGASNWRSTFVTMNGRAGSPTWTCISEDNAAMLLRRDAAGDVVQWNNMKAWPYLPFEEGGGNGQNCFGEGSSASFDPSDVRINRANPDEVLLSGRNGITRLELDNKLASPVNRLGVTANGPIVVDPNSDDHVYVLNTDHVLVGWPHIYADESPRKNENYTGQGGEVAGFDYAVESGVAISHSFEVMGPRNVSGTGLCLYHLDPLGRPDKDWGIVAFSIGGCPVGVEVYRATDPTAADAVRRFVFMAVAGVGFRRGKLQTDGSLGAGGVVQPPTVAQNLQTISGSPNLTFPGGNGHKEWGQIVRITNDILLAEAPWGSNPGLYLIRNARSATPVMHRIWNYGTANDTRGGGGLTAGFDGDSAWVSINSGADKGVYKLTGLATATGASTVGSGITATSISKPSGAWRNPGPIDAFLVNGGVRIAVVDVQNSSGTTPVAPAQVFTSTNGSATVLTDTSSDVVGNLLTKVYDIAQDSTGRVYVSCQGPGVAQYVDPATQPPNAGGGGGGGGGGDSPITITDPAADTALTDNTTIYESGTFTPVEDEYLVAFAYSGDGDGADEPAFSWTGTGVGAWTVHTHDTIVTGGKQLTVATALVTGSPSAGKVRATYPDSQTGGGVSVARVADTNGPRQSASAVGNGATRSVDFGELAAAGLSALVVGTIDPTAGAPGYSPTGDDVKWSDAGFDTPAVGFVGVHRIGTTDPVVEITGTAQAWAAAGIEFGVDEGTSTDDRSLRVTWIELTVPDPAASPTPTLTGFDPVEGVEGTEVTVEGTNLSGATALEFNGVSAPTIATTSTTATALVPSGATSGPITVITPFGEATSIDEFTVLTVEPVEGADVPSNGNPVDTLEIQVQGLWIVDRDWVGPDEAAVRIRLIGQEALPSAIREGAEVLYPVGGRAPLRILDSMGGYEGTVSGWVETRDERLALEALKANPGKRVRLIGGDLNIPVQLGAISIERHPTEAHLYHVSIEVEQIDEFSIHGARA